MHLMNGTKSSSRIIRHPPTSHRYASRSSQNATFLGSSPGSPNFAVCGRQRLLSTRARRKSHLPYPPPRLMDYDASGNTSSATATAEKTAGADGCSSEEEQPVLLHGDLDLGILEARRLPNMDMFSEHLRRCFAACRPPSPSSCTLSHRPHHHHHHPRPKIITSDPYVTVSLAGATVARTRVISNSQDPKWNEHFKIPVAHRSLFIEFRVKDNDVFGAELIGTVFIPAALVASGDLVRDWFPVLGPSGKPPKPETALLVSLQYKPIAGDPIYDHGIPGDPEKLGVRDTYFPIRKGGLVTLYQDAHVREGELPDIELEKETKFEHNRCWEDICHAILEAHHLIYIVGWSVYDKVKLVREPTRPLPPEVKNFTLGELLKYKSQEGVRVCLLVWDDKTSHHKFGFKTVCELLDAAYDFSEGLIS